MAPAEGVSRGAVQRPCKSPAVAFLYGARLRGRPADMPSQEPPVGGLVPLGASSTQEALNDGLEPALQAEAWDREPRTDDLSRRRKESQRSRLHSASWDADS
jgi:hypothetical protein